MTLGFRFYAIPPLCLLPPELFLDRSLNTIRVPRFEATAVTGAGVLETLRAICKLVTNKL